MGITLKGIGAIIGVFVILIIFNAVVFGADTKTAYTRDGINFVSKARMDENIKYEYAKPSDYKEVQVPLNTIVVGASEYVEDTSTQTSQTNTKNTQTSMTKQPSPTSDSGSSGNGTLSVIGLLLFLVIGAVIVTKRNDGTPSKVDLIEGPGLEANTEIQNESPIVTPSSLPPAEKRNNNMRNIGVVVLIIGLAGYVLPVWNGRSIVDVANLCNSVFRLSPALPR